MKRHIVIVPGQAPAFIEEFPERRFSAAEEMEAVLPVDTVSASCEDKDPACATVKGAEQRENTRAAVKIRKCLFFIMKPPCVVIFFRKGQHLQTRAIITHLSQKDRP